MRYVPSWERIAEERGEEKGKLEMVMEEIERIQTLYSKGIFTDTAYKELIEPLKNKLEILENVVPSDLAARETVAS